MLTAELVSETVTIAAQGLQQWGVAEHPCLAVAALNPHAGEGGRFGREEIEILRPALDSLRQSGIQVEGPFPADTLFAKAAQPDSKFHAVVAMYHDQGLIPVKTAEFGRSVNWTLGLPVLRTSVDHGTAFEIAGRGVADADPLRAAIDITLDLLHGRLPYGR